MIEWALNYFNGAEFLMFLYIMSTMMACFAIWAVINAVDFIKWYRNTPSQRATEWVNEQIEKDKMIRRG